jgi:hypothetical protein
LQTENDQLTERQAIVDANVEDPRGRRLGHESILGLCPGLRPCERASRE